MAIYFCGMDEKKPLHRSIELQPLSREHHDGLQFVWKLRQGLNNHIDIMRLRDYVNWYWKNHIRAHFFQEEKVLIPYLPLGHSMTDQLKKEHSFIRELTILIDREVDREDIKQLATLIESHIRWEERCLFQFLEERLSQEQLTEIFEKLNDHPILLKEEYKDVFWN